ncbi:ribonuclease H-like domain-containing protein, partial [Tanacetum coccineum]
MEAIEKRFGSNKESKKTQKTLLKQQYENFNRSISEGLDQTYDRLQKLISQLEILGETISQEDMNLKFLRSLPLEWKTYTLIWRNKPDLDTLSMDDLYNNLKFYEFEVKGSSSLNQNSQNVAFVSSSNSSSSNQAYGSNTANTDSISDAMIYSFFANQSNSPQLKDEDLQHIDTNDLEEMDLKWQMAMLTMRARRFLNKTARKINANGFKTIGFNKSKVECYNFHKKGHFTRECRAPRKNRNKEPVRRNMIGETTDTKALVAQDRLGSSSSDSEVSTCSKACLKSYETLKEHYDNLTKDFNKSQLNVGAYKVGLKSVEARIDVYKKNEVVFEEDMKILKLDIKLRDNALTELRKKFEKAKKERDDLKLTLEKFGNSSKNLSKLLEIKVSDKFKTGVGFDSQVVNSHVCDSQENDRYKTSKGYHVVPPPYTGNFMPLKYDLVLADKGEYVFSESVTSIPDVVTSEAKTSVLKPNSVGEPLIKDWISDSGDENETEFKSKQKEPSFDKYKIGNPQLELQEKGVINSGCSRHIIGNKSYLLDYEEIDGGFVAFGGDRKGGRITSKGKISTGKLDFEDVYFVKELKFNLFSVSQMCDKNNSVLFTDTGCVVLSPDFKLLDETHVSLRVPRKDNMYSVDLKNIVPSGGLTYLFAKATLDESNLWHRRLGHINFKTLNKLVRGNLVKGIENLIDLKAKAVNTACYVQNRVLVIKPHNKTPYELLLGRKSTLSFIRPFGYSVTILNTLDHLGKFDGKADEGFFVGYSTNSKAYRVFNSRTRIVEENLYVKFREETPNIAGNRPNWFFDIDALIMSMSYKLVVTENQTNGNASTKENIDAGQDGKKNVPDQKYILLPLFTSDPLLSKTSKDFPDVGFKRLEEEEKMDSEHPEDEDSEVPNTKETRINQEQDANVNSTNNINTINVVDIENNATDKNIVYGCFDDPKMHNLEEIVYSDNDEEVGAETDMNNLATTVPVSPIPTTRVHKDHPLKQIIRDIQSAPQTKRMTKSVTEHGM